MKAFLLNFFCFIVTDVDWWFLLFADMKNTLYPLDPVQEIIVSFKPFPEEEGDGRGETEKENH